MYQNHYGFRDKPFGLAPNPKFLYFNPAIRAAHDGLLADLRARKGVLLLTGDAGCGKTILLRQIWREIDDRDRVVNLHFTNLSLDDFLSFLCENLGVEADGREARIGAIAGFLAERGRQGQAVVLLIDEAENLRLEVLAALPLLSGGDAAARSALQIVLVGRPGLEVKLSDKALVPLRRRIASVYRLERLAGDEVGAFIDHRLAVVGHKGTCPFSRYAVALISRYSAGVPRLINTICDQALQLAVDAGRHRVSTSMVQQIAQDHGLEGDDEAAIAAIIDAETALVDDAVPAGETASPKPVSAVATDAAEDTGVPPARPLTAETETGGAMNRRHRDRTAPARPKRRRRRALLAAALALAVVFIGYLVRPAALEPAFAAGETGWLWLRAGGAGFAHSAFLWLEPGDGAARSADRPDGAAADGRTAEATLLRAQRDALAAQLAALRGTRDLAGRRATAAITSLEKAQSERAELQTKLGRLRAERDELARAAAGHETESADLNERLDFSRNSNAADRREIETRLVELAMVKMERDDLRRKLAAARRQFAGPGAGSGAGPVNLIRKAASKAKSADRVSALMERAGRQSRKGKLILPAGDNAIESYHDVLRLAPGHKRALAALDEIKGRYRTRAEQARADGRLSIAGSYYKTILEIDPEDAEAKAALLTIGGNTALTDE